MFRFLSLVTIFLVLAPAASALSVVCETPSNDSFTKPLDNDFYKLQHVLEDDISYSISLTVRKEFHGLPLENVGLVRTKSEKVVLGTSLRIHKVENGFITHVVGIPKSQVHEYKFYVSFTERKDQCPNTKGFYVSLGT